MQKLFIAIIGILFSFQVFAQTLIEFEEYKLDNGLHVILHQDNSSPVVAINVMYHVGSKNEQPDRTGFAHFFEHLMFEGSENIERGEYMKYVQNAGGIFNAATSFDYTYYYEVLPSNQLELGLWLESERMLHLKIDSVGVETQRKVVKEERKAMYENRPYGSLQQEIFANAFKKHPYRWIPIGEAQYIDQATLEEFMEFHQNFYVPNNAVLVIAGDIDIDKIKSLVKEYFGPIPKGSENIYRPNVKEPEQNAEIRDTVFDEIRLPAVVMAYKMPAKGTDDYYAMELLQNLLSGGKSSRLYKSLVDKKQMALQVAAFPYALEDAGLFISFGLANIGVQVNDLENAITSEFEEFIQNGLTDREFQKLKNQTENAFVTGYSTNQGIAQALSTYYTLFEDPEMINAEYEKYKTITKKDLQEVAAKYLRKENRVVLYFLPKAK